MKLIIQCIVFLILARMGASGELIGINQVMNEWIRIGGDEREVLEERARFVDIPESWQALVIESDGQIVVSSEKTIPKIGSVHPTIKYQEHDVAPIAIQEVLDGWIMSFGVSEFLEEVWFWDKLGVKKQKIGDFRLTSIKRFGGKIYAMRLNSSMSQDPLSSLLEIKRINNQWIFDECYKFPLLAVFDFAPLPGGGCAFITTAGLVICVDGMEVYCKNSNLTSPTWGIAADAQGNLYYGGPLGLTMLTSRSHYKEVSLYVANDARLMMLRAIPSKRH